MSVFAVAGRDDHLLHLAVADFHTSVVYEHIRRPTLSPVEPPTER